MAAIGQKQTLDLLADPVASALPLCNDVETALYAVQHHLVNMST